MFGHFFSLLVLIVFQIITWHFPLFKLFKARDNVVQFCTPLLPNFTHDSGFLKKILHFFFISPRCATYPAHFIVIILYLGKCINFENLSLSLPSPPCPKYSPHHPLLILPQVSSLQSTYHVSHPFN